MPGITNPERITQGRSALDRRARLHLVMDAERLAHALRQGGEDLARLSNIREVFPDLVLTIFASSSFPEAHSMISECLGAPPDHLLTDGGRSLHHRTAGQGLVRDPGFDDWLAFQGQVRSQAGGLLAAGLECLEIDWAAPRPLMVVGRLAEASAALGLADLPVIQLGRAAPSDETAPLGPLAFIIRGAGLSEVIPLVLAYLANGSRDPATIRSYGRRRRTLSLTVPDGHASPSEPSRTPTRMRSQSTGNPKARGSGRQPSHPTTP